MDYMVWLLLVPLIRKTFNNQGFSILAASIILAIMILPTIINISESAIRSVPKEYKEASLALGGSHWQAIYKVIVPAARSGIITGIILGMGRAIGETMAVIMIAGNSTLIPESIIVTYKNLNRKHRYRNGLCKRRAPAGVICNRC